MSYNFFLKSRIAPLDIQKTIILFIEGKTLQQNSLEIPLLDSRLLCLRNYWHIVVGWLYP
jgi:hypothetical protein